MHSKLLGPQVETLEGQLESKISKKFWENRGKGNLWCDISDK